MRPKRYPYQNKKEPTLLAGSIKSKDLKTTFDFNTATITFQK